MDPKQVFNIGVLSGKLAGRTLNGVTFFNTGYPQDLAYEYNFRCRDNIQGNTRGIICIQTLHARGTIGPARCLHISVRGYMDGGRVFNFIVGAHYYGFDLRTTLEYACEKIRDQSAITPFRRWLKLLKRKITSLWQSAD